MWSAKYHQNTRFQGFWKMQVMTQWPHQGSMFFASTDLWRIWIIKHPLDSASRAAFHCCPMHLPHDRQGWKSRRELARISSDSSEIQHLFFLATWRLGWTCTSTVLHTMPQRTATAKQPEYLFINKLWQAWWGIKNFDSPCEWWKRIFIIRNLAWPYLCGGMLGVSFSIYAMPFVHRLLILMPSQGANFLAVWYRNLTRITVTPICSRSLPLHPAKTQGKRKSWSFYPGYKKTTKLFNIYLCPLKSRAQNAMTKVFYI